MEVKEERYMVQIFDCPKGISGVPGVDGKSYIPSVPKWQININKAKLKLRKQGNKNVTYR